MKSDQHTVERVLTCHEGGTAAGGLVGRTRDLRCTIATLHDIFVATGPRQPLVWLTG